MSPKLAIVGLAIVPPVAGMAVLYGRFVRIITRQVQDSLADATKVAEERISNMRTVKTFSQELREIDTYKDCIKRVLKLGYKESKMRAIFYGMVCVTFGYASAHFMFTLLLIRRYCEIVLFIFVLLQCKILWRSNINMYYSVIDLRLKITSKQTTIWE